MIIRIFKNSLGYLNKLRFLRLGYNNLSGAIPSQLGTSYFIFTQSLCIIGLLKNLTYLSLESNPGIYGGIPPDFGRLESLVSLYLGGSDLNGSIPTEIGA